MSESFRHDPPVHFARVHGMRVSPPFISMNMCDSRQSQELPVWLNRLLTKHVSRRLHRRVSERMGAPWLPWRRRIRSPAGQTWWIPPRRTRLADLCLGGIDKWVWVKIKPPEGTAGFVFGSIYQGFILGTYFRPTARWQGLFCPAGYVFEPFPKRTGCFNG